jgi:hypothetical protein
MCRGRGLTSTPIFPPHHYFLKTGNASVSVPLTLVGNARGTPPGIPLPFSKCLRDPPATTTVSYCLQDGDGEQQDQGQWTGNQHNNNNNNNGRGQQWARPSIPCRRCEQLLAG